VLSFRRMTTASLAPTTDDAAISVSARSRARIASVDVVRGAVMVLMALDHVRDYVTDLRFPPEDLARGTAVLFATRWVTHFCAPAFFLLAGIGIGVLANRGAKPGDLSRYLITRGLWLLVLELVITPIGWQFGFRLIPAFALVLWALGWSMIAMALLVHLPRALVGVLSVVVIAGHNLFDGLLPESFGALAPLWSALHVPGFVIPGVLFIGYPLVPWFAVMALGYVLAGAFTWEDVSRRRLFLILGVAAVALFIVLRAMNGYGNSFLWSEQRTPALTVASFLNVRKYPPSLMFLLMTLGPVLVALALTERARGWFANWLAVYGRVPLFYYVGHIVAAHVVAMALAFAQSGELRRVPIIHDPGAVPASHGVGLVGVYIAWMLVVSLMYYPCREFARLKETRTDWWLRYL
jgi:uncharacterized membrane protein